MKKLIIGLASVVVAVLIFTGGVFASQWISFTGDETVQQSNGDVDEIMQILRDVNEEKLSIEEALAELEALPPKGLVDKIKSLEDDLANKQVELNNKIAEIEEKQKEINEKNSAYDQLQQERDSIATQRDELQANIDSSGQYIQHLEEELTRANEAVQGHGNKTQQAVEEAREIKGDN